MMLFTFLLLCHYCLEMVLSDNFSRINLPLIHIPYYMTSFPNVAEECAKNPTCPYKHYLNEKKYWGYEYGHKWGQQYSIPDCPGDHRGWVKTKFDQQNTFYIQGDFGYIKQQLLEMKILCEPLFVEDSMLECSDHLRYCRGRNLMINFTNLIHRHEPLRYKMDVLSYGDIGGWCDLNKEELTNRADHISALQSWGPELRNFIKMKRRPIPNGDCDVIVDKPTYIMKIDATVNMYHHFCDFLNLYASQHMNKDYETFSTDVNVLIWESYTYHSLFQETWKAFTKHPLWNLNSFKGKTVCFKNLIFPLLPRMIFGLYYNTPLIYGCKKSGLFHAFSKHILHRLKIPIHFRHGKTIRITFLSRDTRYRKILNEEELLNTLSDNDEYDVRKVIFNKDIPFRQQLEVIANTDILVGIHGAGLTHLLFLPDWAAVFEVYNCEDANCYADLARLRGLHYVTWRNTSKLTSVTDGSYQGGAHAKFANYRFDPDEFKSILVEASSQVKEHPNFVDSTQHPPKRDEL
ncbi:hypothetical protein ABEB36_002486 [Hypothenemus hampei]|uniref:EGF domain-specific O-linked N-acetylglucosamine transferase n=1 Tax=Hypothenemus hampei TaxID=57062 RepID=A0ABD1F6B5_HYPHA